MAHTARRCAARGDGDQGHDGIAVPVPVLPCGCDQALDLFGGQVLAGAALGLRNGLGGTVPFSVLGMVARAVVPPIARTVSHTPNCPIMGRKWDSRDPTTLVFHQATVFGTGCKGYAIA